MNNKLLTHVGTLAVLLTPMVLVHAATTYNNPVTYAGVSSIPCFLVALVDLIFLVGVPIIVLFIIYSGFLFVTGGDNEAQVKKARFVFTWTMVGALVLLGAKAIALAVKNTVLSLGGMASVVGVCA